jgi:hypothetical protein
MSERARLAADAARRLLSRLFSRAVPDADRTEAPTSPDPLKVPPEELAEARRQNRYWVSEYDGARGSTGHGGHPKFGDACEMAKQLSRENRDRAFRVLDPDSEIVAVAMNGKVTDADGNGPAIDPEGPTPKNAKKHRPWRRKKVGEERPQSWSNWNAFLGGAKPTCAEEFELYSDSIIHGAERDFGPYRVINLMVGLRRETAIARPVVTLRIGHVTTANPRPEDAEHGGRHPDEIAALISLLLGVRLQAGGSRRFFAFANQDRDPLGRPKAQAEVEEPYLPQGSWAPIIAQAVREVIPADLDELNLLTTFPALSSEDATALVRAARLYQAALWGSEREAMSSWAQLVLAVETLATRVAEENGTPPEVLLKEYDKELWNICKDYGDECVRRVAVSRVRKLAAKRKFVGFLTRFLPDPPRERPASYLQDWSAEGLDEPLREVYELRSGYVHSGIPFPWQLYRAPQQFGGVPVEYMPDEPVVAAAHRLSKPRLNKTRPIHLHVFAHLVRGAIVKWWREAEQPPRTSVGGAPPHRHGKRR